MQKKTNPARNPHENLGHETPGAGAAGAWVRAEGAVFIRGAWGHDRGL